MKIESKKKFRKTRISFRNEKADPLASFSNVSIQGYLDVTDILSIFVCFV